MYEGFKCQVLYDGKLTEYIKVTTGVREGCILSPTIFLLVLDDVMRKTTSIRQRGIQWGMMDRLEDLDFADDICLMAQSFQDMEGKLTNLQEEAKRAGLDINVNKTIEMRVNNKIQRRCGNLPQSK
jgi:hypothetical protein